MVKKMQVPNIGRLPDVRSWLFMWVNSLAALFGLRVVSLDSELVQVGCRQIPSGHCDFDPALADHFKSLNMRNGKHITLALDYAVVAKWNRSNKKRGRDERTYGSDRYYAMNYSEVDRKTWGKHMDELAALGLISVSTVKGKPAYQATEYRFLNGVLTFVSDSHGQLEDFHAHGSNSHAHSSDFHAHPSIESKESFSSALEGIQSSATARDAVDEISKPIPSENIAPQNPIPAVKVDDEPVVGDDTRGILSQPDNPIPPVPVAPLSPVAESDPDCEAEELQTFFTGYTVAQVKTLIAQHGAARIYGLIKVAAANPKIINPPGFVLDQLEAGTGGQWRMPKHVIVKARDEQSDQRYVTGKYADFIQH